MRNEKYAITLICNRMAEIFASCRKSASTNTIVTSHLRVGEGGNMAVSCMRNATGNSSFIVDLAMGQIYHVPQNASLGVVTNSSRSNGNIIHKCRVTGLQWLTVADLQVAYLYCQLNTTHIKHYISSCSS